MIKIVIGKFGAESKLSNTITIEPGQYNDLSWSFRKLLEYCLSQNNLIITKSQINIGEEDSLDKIIKQTSDLCFLLDNECKFYVHKVF